MPCNTAATRAGLVGCRCRWVIPPGMLSHGILAGTEHREGPSVMPQMPFNFGPVQSGVLCSDSLKKEDFL